MKRTFVAIKVPEIKKVNEFYHTITNYLKEDPIRWVNLENMHVTIHFLGDTSEENIPRISEQLHQGLKDQVCFRLSVKQFGIFKNIQYPRVLWLGLEKKDEFTDLKMRVDNVVSAFGYEKETRKFYPHLTLGRCKYLKNKVHVKNLIEEYKSVEFGRFEVKHVIFYESILKREGPEYKKIDVIDLKCT